MIEISLEPLLTTIQNEFKTDWNGLHGIHHWNRVLGHGIRIAKKRNADLDVVTLFALLHDSCRWSDGYDSRHGERGAEFAYGLNGKLFCLDDSQLDDLCFAIRHHPGGEISTNPTIQTCWDADRLDLGRVGTRPSAQFLSDIASRMIDDAYKLSRKIY
ncbi:HD domain-containing protein [Oxalobacter formigenes]|uniref:HD domain-containing protein n=1 Tax=Oxalobacter formigenes OXCC13 TaxID=556269 RepID=C3XC19_OXAFO|nr:HD domain-containing protein [Oxalobacter formigenes]ARQ45081.1 hypothetical protein BRW83_0313 [Oxalobacter formigenes]ARQ77394.1 hypothetical protein BRW84_01215 [Oxalobacter formigenes OXCC13]EEO30745.1 hypothetical protein OFBG_01773 [Oxalobacter formigenes OXCC13]MCZ4063186.1 hypothetical protein [Oxalobacter formigenes]QDX34070.1 hypothetical protein FPZ51_11160 [Oxalobacter formigenes]